MLLKADILAGIRDGRIDTVFRLWRRPTVKAGGTLQTANGVLAIDAVEPIAPGAITTDDARRAGFATPEALDAWLRTQRDGQLYRMRLHYAGQDPRIALRVAADLTDTDFAEIDAALAKFDGQAPWTDAALRLIAERPETAAAQLAAATGVETLKFKQCVRKLKALGLTESLDIGYRLSPRGKAVLKRRQP